MKKIFSVALIAMTAAFASHADDAAFHQYMVTAQENLVRVVNDEAAANNPDMKRVESALNEVEYVIKKIAYDQSTLETNVRMDKGVLIVGGASVLVLFARAVFIKMGEGLGHGLSFIFLAPLSALTKTNLLPPKPKSLWTSRGMFWTYGVAGVTAIVYGFSRNENKKMARQVERELEQAQKMYSNTCRIYDLVGKSSDAAALQAKMPNVDKLCMSLPMILNQKMQNQTKAN